MRNHVCACLRMIAQCLRSVCALFAQCLRNVRTLFALCLRSVCAMFAHYFAPRGAGTTGRRRGGCGRGGRGWGSSDASRRERRGAGRKGWPGRLEDLPGPQWLIVIREAALIQALSVQ
jgi:hypothetical protein